MANEPTKPNKFFDVAHPGNTAAPAGSRPVIVGNKPIMQDPMMVDKPSGLPVAEHKKSLHPSESFTQSQHEISPKESDGQEVLVSHSRPVASAVLPETDENKKEIEHLIDKKAHYVHIKGAKRKKYAVRVFLFIGTLFALAGAGYYVMSLMQP